MRKSDRVICRLDEMLTEAMNGTFVESSYDETELSRLESKFRQYLTGKEMTEERVQAEQAVIKELVTDISHQTKTPIANICLYSQLLEEISPEDLLPYVQQIRMQAEKLEFLIRMLTKISRLESQMIELRPKLQPVAPLIERTVRDARGAGDARDIVIRMTGFQVPEEKSEAGAVKGTAVRMTGFHVSRETPGKASLSTVETGEENTTPGESETSEGKAASGSEKITERDARVCACYDFRWTQEALGNVLDNAVKYSPPGSTVTVSVRELEMFVCIRVEDQGPGILEEEQAQIFERFYRGSSGKETEGNGVGLYLTRMILQREKGYVKVSSRAETGSCFQIYLSKR